MPDFINKKYNKLTILSVFQKKRNGKLIKWAKSICACGNTHECNLYSILDGRTTSCGCNYRLNLINKKFGKLTAIEIVEPIRKQTAFRCVCECGRERIVIGSVLKLGNITCCGCSNGKEERKVKHLDRTLYEVWKGMRARCGNKNHISYKNYGGRGIEVCELWRKSFLPFYEWATKNGYQKGLSLDRYPNNNGNYEPANCRWTTQIENSRNTRRVKLNLIKAEEIRNSNLSARELAFKYGIDVTTVNSVKRYKIWIP